MLDYGCERRFSKNLRRVVCAKGMAFAGFGEVLHDRGWSPTPHAAVRRMRRVCRGETRLTLNDLETIAGALGIPPAVLAYGTLQELEEAMKTRNRHRSKPRQVA